MSKTILSESQYRQKSVGSDKIEDGSIVPADFSAGIYRPGFFKIGDTTGTNLVPYVLPNTVGLVVLRRFFFPGSNTCGIPSEFSVVARCTSVPNTTSPHYIEWYNEDDGIVIAKIRIEDATVSVKRTTAFDNVPVSSKVCAIRTNIPSAGKKTLEIHCWNIQF